MKSEELLALLAECLPYMEVIAARSEGRRPNVIADDIRKAIHDAKAHQARDLPVRKIPR
jgi:hypothetical protein